MTDVRRPDDPYPPPPYPPTPPHGTGWPPPPPPLPPPPPRRRIGLIIAIVAAVVLAIPVILFGVALVAVAVNGPVPSVTAPGTPKAPPGQVGLLQLRPGSCFDSAPVPADGSTVGIAGVTAVPCEGPHTRQVVSTLAYPDTTWEAGQAKAGEHCGNAFRTDVREDARTDSAYVPAIMHSIVNRPGGTSLYVACVLTTEAPRTGSVLQ